MLEFLRGRPAQAATLLLLSQAAVYYSISRTEVIPATPPWSQFPGRIDQWQIRSESVIDQQILDALQPDDYLNRTYATPDGSREPVSLFIGYFRSQRQGFDPHSPEDCLPGAGWKAVSNTVFPLPVAEGSIPVNRFVIERPNVRLLVLYWYQQGKKAFASQQQAQLAAIPALLLHDRTDIALVRIISPLDPQAEAAADEHVHAFASRVHDLVIQHIP